MQLRGHYCLTTNVEHTLDSSEYFAFGNRVGLLSQYKVKVMRMGHHIMVPF